ncbi:MAG: O-methyltransferase [Candidatus Rokuibacteriota bacterium]
MARALLTTALDRIDPAEREWTGKIESRRGELLEERALTSPVFDSGAPGPKGDLGVLHEPVPVEVASILMSQPTLWCVLLMRLVRELRPSSCLELGTAFGISGAYQAAALELNGEGSLTTLEGAREWADIAEQGFSELGLARVETLVGPIEQTFAAAADSGPFDYVFVDAEHSEQAIRSYFHLMTPHLSSGAVVVFDDIDWSEGAWRSWHAVRRHERVARSASLGRMGVAIIGAA